MYFVCYTISIEFIISSEFDVKISAEQEFMASKHFFSFILCAYACYFEIKKKSIKIDECRICVFSQCNDLLLIVTEFFFLPVRLFCAQHCVLQIISNTF